MRSWRERLALLDRLVLRVVHFCARVLLWPSLYAVAWAAAIWPLTHPERLQDWGNGRLNSGERIQQLNYLLAAAGVMAVLLVGFLCIGRVRRGDWQLEARAESFNRFFAFSLAAPFLAGLMNPGVESARPIHTLFWIACATICVTPTVAQLWDLSPKGRAEPTPTWRARLRAVAPLFVVAGLFAAYGLWFSDLSINSHHALKTRILDLAIYDNIFYQSSHGNFLGCNFCTSGSHVNGHFDAILVLLSPLYYIYPRAELILILQAFWCGAGVVPAYLLGRRHLGSAWAGVTFAAAWVLYPALHGANLYEFHSLTLLAMPMLWLLYLLTAGHLRAYYILFPIVLLIREDVSLLLCCVGLAAVLTGDRRLVRAGWITIAVAGLYFVLIKTFIMGAAEPLASIDKFDPLGGKHGFGWYYTDLIPRGGGLGGLLNSLVTNPMFALDFALREPKVIYLLQLLLPLAFLPLFAKSWRFATVFGLVYILLASRRPVYSIHFQYSVVLFPVLFALAPLGLRRLRDGELPGRLGLARDQLVTVLLACVLVSSFLMSWKFGGAVPNSSFRAGFVKPTHSLTQAQEQQYEEFRALIEQMGPSASVTVVGRAGPHVSNRTEAFRYKHKKQTEYVLVDDGKLRGRMRKYHQQRLAGGELELIGKTGPYQLFRVVK